MIYFMSMRLAEAYIDRYLDGRGTIRYDSEAAMYYILA